MTNKLYLFKIRPVRQGIVDEGTVLIDGAVYSNYPNKDQVIDEVLKSVLYTNTLTLPKGVDAVAVDLIGAFPDTLPPESNNKDLSGDEFLKACGIEGDAEIFRSTSRVK